MYFQFRRKQSTDHTKESHLLIPGGPSRCWSGFLKVLDSEGPTWVSSALFLPVCDWRNRWAELQFHLILDVGFYSCIGRWAVGPCSRAALLPQPDTGSPMELLGTAHIEARTYTLSIWGSHFLMFTLYMCSTTKDKRGLWLFVSLIFKVSYRVHAPCCIPRNLWVLSTSKEQVKRRVHIYT